MKTRTKLFLVYLTAVAFLLILLSFTYYQWFQSQKSLAYEANLQAALNVANLLEAKFDKDNLKKILANEPAAIRLTEKRTILIYDQTGKLQYASVPAKDSKQQITATAAIGKSGWQVAVASTKSAIYGPIYLEIQRQVLIVTFLVLIITVVVPFLFYRWIISPIVYLSQVTKKIAEGNLNQQVFTRSRGVIGTLTKNLEAMRLEIKRRISELTKARLEAEIARQKDEAILTSIGDGVFAIDKQGKIFLFNDMAEQISGYLRSEVIGQKYNQVLRFGFEEDLTPNYQFIERVLRTGDVTKMQNHAVLIGKNVKPVSVEVSASPINDRQGNITGAIVVFRDVTIERQLENLKDDFFRISSHELKTPMSIIKGYVHMILDGDAGPISEQTKNYLNDILPVIKRQLALVDDLLRVSQFESSRIPFELATVVLAEIVQNSTGEITPTAAEKELQIEIDKSCKQKWPKIQADPDKVRLILNNLLGNAVKFTEKGKIIVSMGQKKDQLVVYITDTGIGIHKDMQNYLFRRFSQVGTVLKRKSGGTGLGLFITRFVAQKMGGQAWLESSEVGKGSTFVFSLPIMGSEEAKAAKLQIERETEARTKLDSLAVRAGSLRPPSHS